MSIEEHIEEHTSPLQALPDNAVKATILNMQHGFGRYGGMLATIGLCPHAEKGGVSFDLPLPYPVQVPALLQILNDQIADGARVIFQMKS